MDRVGRSTVDNPEWRGERTDPEERRLKVQLAMSAMEPEYVVNPPVAEPEVPSAIVQPLMLK